jgi:hypothetical protein
MSVRPSLTSLGLLAGVILLGACSTGEASRPDPSEPAILAPQEVVVRARDFLFEAPDTVFSGTTTFRLINDGPEFHHIQLVRLEDGRTLDDLMRHLAERNPWPAWALEVGGPNTPGIPGEETNGTLELQPGSYALLCVIPSPDGTPHIMKGMVRPLTVITAAGPTAPLPRADVVMVLDDYSFETDRPITAGRRTIRVENTAAQPHEVVFAKLEPGKTAMDFLKFMENPQGPPPGKLVGGTSGFAHGVANVVTIDFEPGEYALLCFIPDAGDGAPHFMHGMVDQITVR